MPLFMDVHSVEGGVSAADVAGAHEADLATQGEYGVNYLRYWVDEEAGKIFCLVDAPDAEAANTVHRQAHGLVTDANNKAIIDAALKANAAGGLPPAATGARLRRTARRAARTLRAINHEQVLMWELFARPVRP